MPELFQLGDYASKKRIGPAIFHQVFNLVEDVVQHNQRIRDDNARLRAENDSLRELLQKAEVKPPPSKPLATNAPDPNPSRDHSSEKERAGKGGPEKGSGVFVSSRISRGLLLGPAPGTKC